jgi:sortase A
VPPGHSPCPANGPQRDVVGDIYFTTLLQHIGCTAYAVETAALFGGDDIAVRVGGAKIDVANPKEALPFLDTGFPWEEEANVYIAGHRLGFEGTDSHLAFWDLNELEEGDEIYITDSEGRKYTYVVFKKVVATPENLGVLAPIEGKNIVTLQTCTLPDYVNRLLVRGGLKDISEG